jgi:hypothetical protein
LSAYIDLPHGLRTLVSDEDFARFGHLKWHAVRRADGTVYAGRKNPATKGKLYLHRAITGARKGLTVDHINGDGLDNRRENLRVCTLRKNLWNTRKARTASTSRFKGVSYESAKGKWKAAIRGQDGKNVTLGRFDDEEDAARAYNEAARRLRGEYARLNLVDGPWRVVAAGAALVPGDGLDIDAALAVLDAPDHAEAVAA